MWLDRAVKWLLPREEHFFDLLERGSACAGEGASFTTGAAAALDLPTPSTPQNDRCGNGRQMADKSHADDYLMTFWLQPVGFSMTAWGK